MLGKTGRRVARLVLGLMVAGMAGEGCLSFQTYCEELVDCENGNDADVDACVVAANTEEDRASLYGCTEWFEIYAECREAKAECQNDRYVLTGNDCDDEAREFGSCMNDNLPPSPF